jgi:NADP-dependent 3-hydroxy acid dehydrogenase YdfG
MAPNTALAGYSSTKSALKLIADCLRLELNSSGVRVMSVYPGKTASAMQQRAHELAGKPYDAASLMQPEDVAQMVLSALALPKTAEMTDLHIRPMKK